MLKEDKVAVEMQLRKEVKMEGQSEVEVLIQVKVLSETELDG